MSKDTSWGLIKQPNKLGYVNNPNWTNNATSSHTPCGYWHGNLKIEKKMNYRYIPLMVCVSLTGHILVYQKSISGWSYYDTGLTGSGGSIYYTPKIGGYNSTAYIVYVSGGNLRLAKSTNSAASFVDIGIISSIHADTYYDMYVVNENSIIFVFAYNDAGTKKLRFASSKDGGGTFLYSFVESTLYPTYCARISCLNDNPSNIIVSYATNALQRLQYRTSNDGGITWSAYISLAYSGSTRSPFDVDALMVSTTKYCALGRCYIDTLVSLSGASPFSITPPSGRYVEMPIGFARQNNSSSVLYIFGRSHPIGGGYPEKVAVSMSSDGGITFSPYSEITLGSYVSYLTICAVIDGIAYFAYEDSDYYVRIMKSTDMNSWSIDYTALTYYAGYYIGTLCSAYQVTITDISVVTAANPVWPFIKNDSWKNNP